MSKIKYMRTALFVPGNRLDRVEKAFKAGADIVIIDLEDAVPLAEKTATRLEVGKKLKDHPKDRIMVRINALDTGLAEDDLNAVVVPGLDAVMLPKVESPEHVEQICSMISAIEAKNKISEDSVSLVALIETALGIEKAFEVAASKKMQDRLLCLAFGAADYTLDLGISISKTGEELFFSRARLVNASRAAGLQPPLDTPYMIDLKDIQALEDDIARGRKLGFGGKLCIHPNQIEMCNRLYSPSDKEIAFAGKVVKEFEEAEALGRAAIQVDGKFIDYPIVAASKRILEIAKNINATI